MKILVCGDWHGNTVFVENIFNAIAREGWEVDVIVQVGDFGFWEHRDEGVHFLDSLSTFSQESGIPIYWVDGNHENFEILYDQYLKGRYDEFIEIRPSIYYIPRGKTWEWDGVKFMGFGGAYSIDKNHRTPYISWWPQEMASDEEIERVRSKNEQVDVLFSHDVPQGVDVLTASGGFLLPIASAEHSRYLIRQVAEVARPKLIVHGHYHFRYGMLWGAPWGEVSVIGLTCDGRQFRAATYMLDTNELLPS
jgi:Icc-related predicted phosphoesterase